MWHRIRLPALWTPRQRWALLAAVTAVWLIVLASRWTRPSALPDPPGSGPRSAELTGRLDPNTADAAALSALPDLGTTRAAAIVDYRTAFARRHPGRPAFTAARDLLAVHGVGTSMAENLTPYLSFTAQPR